ncbi:ribonuclease T2 precursor [Metarhizium rileyi]|uniref:ribonuclease T2 n=1 Tax=Metarhizium rileyi (strain RCEF 4871) TaxID=1649241 RepID=A0A167HC63_METRR|nr:ribonuclease T2 precursor [Metarhizium rileyi RCEF 4871]
MRHRAGLVLGLVGLADVAAAGLYPGIAPDNHTCALADPVLSCSCQARPDKVKDSCCVETFGGLLIATQLWSTFTGLEDKGQVYPKNEWSIHGLWPGQLLQRFRHSPAQLSCSHEERNPDLITQFPGSYTQYCDFSRQYDPRPSPNTTDGQPGGVPVPAYQGESIEKWFEPYGKLDLLAYMRKHWVSQHDSNWVFWAHEFSKHATCFSTFQKECYVSIVKTLHVRGRRRTFQVTPPVAHQGPKASEHDDLFDFFETAVAWQRRLPSFQWLSDAGIRPSNTTGYTFSAVRHALTRAFGQPPFLGCGGPKYNETRAGRGSNDSGRTEINEIWYYYHVNGTPQRGDARKLNADEAGGRLTTCALAPGAIKYYERAEGSEEGDLSAEMMEM